MGHATFDLPLHLHACVCMSSLVDELYISFVCVPKVGRWMAYPVVKLQRQHESFIDNSFCCLCVANRQRQLEQLMELEGLSEEQVWITSLGEH